LNELSGYVFSSLREGDIALYRGSGNGLTPILLVAAEESSPGYVERLEHEYALKSELDADWAARPAALTHDNGRMTLVLEDPGGTPLDRLLGRPLNVSHFLRIAIPLTGALRHVHERGLIHKDIKPENILVESASSGVWLTGFGIASRLPRERQAPAPPEVIAGTLAYMAPEQTGRMNRSVDSRSDLYALGVTFYEMLTGQLPFTASDPMEWVHCHIARQPMPPDERVAGVPEPLSAIVMKLLAKTGEERYQTAAGVENDLRHCLAERERKGRIDPFALGEHDAPDRLLLPEKLYGRAREIDGLLASFDRIIKSGAPELVLVSGYSGIGKSSVVNELHRVLVQPRGLFASGKFDQYKRDIPYSTLAQAFQSLIRPLLAKSDPELAGWREAFREALGPNGRLFVDLIPELKLIVGEQPPVPELLPHDAQRRFQLVFRRFLAVFAQPEHPLALFLDDLQWLDSATLDLLEDLLTQPDVQHLMLIGAYRDNEVDATHPLRRKLDTIKSARGRVEEIALAPLAREHLEHLIADALRCEPARAAPLAQLVHEKTGGNPFFAIQFLYALAEEGLLTFDHGATCWSWDPHRIRAKRYTDNVVDLMVGKLSRLPAETQTALQLMACLGNAAKTAMLSIVLEVSAEQVESALWGAIRQELIEPLEGSYRFMHDRVQEAAYSLIPEERRTGAHLRIGQLLMANTPPRQREEAVFDIVSHLNRGAALITAQDKREQLAELNLVAGKRAKAATAYASALSYLNAGAALLVEDCWEHQHELIFQLELHRAECEFLTGAPAAEQRLNLLSTRAANMLERAAVACLRVDLYTSLDQSSRAIAVGLDYLQHLGIDWSPHPTQEEARREYQRIWSQLGGRTIESLIELPLMSDPASLATLDVLAKIVPPAFYTDANLLALITCRAVNLSLEGGNCDASCSAYEWLTMLAGPHFGDYRTAVYRFGQLGYDLVEERRLRRFQARTYMDFGGSVLPWTRHVRAGRDLLRRAFEAANKIGDLNYAAYCGNQLNTNFLAAGDPLAEAEREAEHGLAFAQKMRFGLVIDLITPQLGLIRTLRGLTPTFGCFDDEQFDEARIERRFSENPDLVFGECFYWIRKLQARFFAGDYASALDASSRAQRLLWSLGSQLETAEYQFYGALSQAASCDSAAAGERQQPYLDAIVAHHKQLQLWAANCPDNFDNRAALVGAEIARIEGRELDAERLYEQAIRSARANGFIHNEALANELASHFYAARGFEKIARVYLQDARYGYLCWGADGKVRQLDRLNPSLAAAEAHSPTANIGSSVQQLDAATVVKASQAVSSEIVLSKLTERLMTIALENAGADRGLLILPAEDGHLIQAEAKAAGDQIEVVLCQKLITGVTCPESIVRYVVRTRESVILDDASRPNIFSEDDYLRGRPAKSILCLPLIKQGRLTALLYLENTLSSYAFSPDRIAVLELLAAQAAISLENTRLYSDLQEREAKVRRLVESNIIGISIFGFDGRVIEANEAFLHIVGHSRDDIVSGRVSWSELTPAEWQEADDRAVAELRATGSCKTYEKEYLRHDGRRVPVLVGAAAFDGPRDQGVCFVLDLTERKRAEEALRESEAKFSDYAATASDWLWEIGPDYRYTLLTDNAFRSDPADRIGTLCWDHALDLETEPEKWQLVWATLDSRKPFGDFVYCSVDGNGSPMYVKVSGKPVFDANGEFRGYRGTGTDVTALRAIEAEARESERRYREAQLELAHANRVATMGQLTSSIAHEVNQPITAAVTYALAARRWLSAEPPNFREVDDALSLIVKEGNRAGAVVGRIRALIKKAPARKDAVQINDAILEVIALTHTEAANNSVSVRTQLAESLPRVQGDRVQLQQVLLNLIINAIEAMRDIGEEERELLISSRNEPDGVSVELQDSGPGLASADLDRVFEAFYTTKPSGLGLGLSICRSIIEAHNGQLWASANLPRGASFQFALPAIANTAS
jgi:PAS domain S-box-containing protein